MDSGRIPERPSPGAPPPRRPAKRAVPRRREGYVERTRRGTRISALFAVGLVLASLLFVGGSRLSRRYMVRLPGGQKPQLALSGAGPAEADLTVAEIVAAAGPSVVSIDLYLSESVSAGGSASGVVLSADGYIATNAHVINQFPLIRVVLANGQGHTARVVGTDVRNDLAVLKINAHGLTPATFGDSSQLAVGSQVVAIGNAAGILPGTPSLGILSGVNRQVSVTTTAGEVVLLDLLQTDAAINPGNSGGALVDGQGRVIGINVAKLEDANVENIGFAIPAGKALPILQKLIDQEQDGSYAKLGVSVLALNETTGPAQNLPEKGLYITELSAESSLPEAGVSTGDVILQADGEELATTEDLLEKIAQHEPGDEMELLIFLPKTGEVHSVTARLYDAGLF